MLCGLNGMGDGVGLPMVRSVRHWVANRGWLGMLAEVFRQMKLRWSSRGKDPSGRAGASRGLEVHPFDSRYGVDTGGLIWGQELRSGEKGEYWATGYYGISPSFFEQALDRLGLEWPKYTFLDVGCGKGRALMLALRYPFRRIVGVELSPELVRVANNNLGCFQAEWRKDVSATAFAGDATRFDLPGGPLLVYLYHPFAAPVMREFLKHLETSLGREPRAVYVMYVNPELDRLLERTPFLEKMTRDCLPMTEEDIAADRFGSREEHMSVYRARPVCRAQLVR